MFSVCATQCDECLFSKHRLVSAERRKEIIAECLQQGNEKYFRCHKDMFTGKPVCCRAFYDLYGDRVSIIQIAQRLQCIEFVDIDTFAEMCDNVETS